MTDRQDNEEKWRLEQLAVGAAIEETEMICQQVVRQNAVHRQLFESLFPPKKLRVDK